MSLLPAVPSARIAGRCLLAAVLLLAAACGGDDGASAEPSATAATAGDTGAPVASGDECAPASLETLEEGTLTLATSEPAFEPWMVDNDPTNGEGFESAVAYAVAEQLGYTQDQVTWVRVPFDAAIQPGPKDFDADINQFSITEERRQAVDFSAPYYDVRQAVITIATSPAAGATTIEELHHFRIGAQVGTTSLAAITDTIKPMVQPSVFNTNEDAKLALSAGQIDALVVDLPTAFFLTAVELEGGSIIGQLPASGGQEQFGLLLDKDSPLTDCVSEAVDALRADGTLDALEQEWLADVAGAPELS